MVRVVAREIDPALSQELDIQMNHLYELTSDSKASPGEIGSTARRASELADHLVSIISTVRFDSPLVAHLLQQLSSKEKNVLWEGIRSAEQTWMALDSLFRFYEKQKGNEAISIVHVALEELFHEFDDPSTYNAARFSVRMQKLSAALRDAGITQW